MTGHSGIRESSSRGRTPLWRAGAACGGGVLLIVVAALLALAFPRWFLMVGRDVPRADLIIVLGGETASRGRLCAELYRSGVSRHVIISGAGDTEPIEILLRSEGVPGSSILAEDKSVSTFENARLTAPLLRQMHARSAVIVTSWFHTRRALACFQRAAPEVRFTAAAAPYEWPTTGARLHGLAREYAKLGGYWIAHGVPPWTRGD